MRRFLLRGKSMPYFNLGVSKHKKNFGLSTTKHYVKLNLIMRKNLPHRLGKIKQTNKAQNQTRQKQKLNQLTNQKAKEGRNTV